MGHYDSRMFYNAQNGAPWHQTGKPIDGLATKEQVRELVPELFVPVRKEPVFDQDGCEIPELFANFRQASDHNGRTFLGSCGDEYSVLQDEVLFDACERIAQDPHGPLFETAGMLWGGRKTWVLMRFPDDMVLKGRNGREDVVRKYLLGTNAHDSSQRIRFGATSIRPVCDNTLSMAVHSLERNSSATICHSGDVERKIANLPNLLQIAAKDFEQTQELYQALIACEPSQEQIDEVLRRLIPDTESKRAELQRERVLQLAETGRGNAQFAGTAWSLFNGYTELKDWFDNAGSKRADALDMRANATLFGSAKTAKEQALKVIRDVCLN